MTTIKRPWRKRLKYNLIYSLVKTIIWISNILPRKWFVYWCGWLGGLGFYLIGDSRRICLSNLALAYGHEKSPREIRRMAKRNFVMMGRNAGDLVRAIPIQSLEKLEHLLEVRGREHLPPTGKLDRGTIFLTVHMGPFEFVGSYLGLAGYQTNIIGTELKDPRLNDLLVDYRKSKGSQAIPRGQATMKLFRTLKEGGNLAILIDTDTRVKSVFVNFYGIPAATPIGAAMFALRTGARVVPLFSFMDRGLQPVLEIGPEIAITNTGDEEADIITNTQLMTDICEGYIRRYPEQWLWIQDRWKTRPG